MTGPLDPAPPATNDRAESEAEAANRQNMQAAEQLTEGQANAGFGEPGGEDTQVSEAPQKPGGMASEGTPSSDARGGQQGMMGEGV